jgi:RNA polymerase-binding protein DksA
MTVKVNLQKITEKLKTQQKTLMKRMEGASDTDSLGKPLNPDRTDLARSYQENHRKKLLLARTEEQLQAIDRALLRLNEGTYGKCDNCGNQIETERLEIMPAVALCIKCQQEKNQ